MAAYERVWHLQEVMDGISRDWDPDLRAQLISDFGLVQLAHAKRNQRAPRRSFPYYRGVIRMLLARRGWDLDAMPWGKLKSRAKQLEFEGHWRELCGEEPELARCIGGR